MIKLTADNALDYLRERGWIEVGPARVELLGGGVSNMVLRVETSGRALVLKQSCPQLRTRDTWLSDLDRVYREQEVMEVLGPLLPALTVPEVLHVDRTNFTFAMSSAPADARPWKEALLAGRADAMIAERSGTVLGRMHEATGQEPKRIERFRDRKVFGQLRIDPFYRRVQERRPEVAAAVAPLIDELLTRQDALCHGDFTPKNILIHADSFTLVDYETAHLGDPTMDLGLFLAHLLLKAVRFAPAHRPYLDLTTAFWRGYGREVHFQPLSELLARGVRHLGVCLLARIDGTSPVDYLPDEPHREVVRRLGRRLLLEAPRDWDTVLDWCDDELRCLP